MSMLGRSAIAPGPSGHVQNHKFPQQLVPHLYTTSTRNHSSQRQSVIAQSNEKGNFGDELLDFMYAGKKLRKWYGEEGMVLPRDGREPSRPDNDQDPEEEEQGEYTGPRDHVLVLDADSSPMAEQVLLQLILARAKVKAFAKKVEDAQKGFGPYVDVIGEESGDAKAFKRVLRNVNAVISCSKLSPQLISSFKAAGVSHLVLLSMVGSSPKGFSLFGGGETSTLSDAAREQQASSSGIATTIVRVGSLLDLPGGESELSIAGGKGQIVGGAVSREDAAKIIAEAALFNREDKPGVVVCGITSRGAGQPPGDYNKLMSSLMQSAA